MRKTIKEFRRREGDTRPEDNNSQQLQHQVQKPEFFVLPYVGKASEKMLHRVKREMTPHASGVKCFDTRSRKIVPILTDRQKGGWKYKMLRLRMRFLCVVVVVGSSYSVHSIVSPLMQKSMQNINFCLLCNLERREIAEAKRANLLNSRNELITKCANNRNLFLMTSRKLSRNRAGSSSITWCT